jgi:hypothetical protein
MDGELQRTDPPHEYPFWQRILMFPLVVVFTCEWHRIHTSILFCGAILLISGFCLGSRNIAGLGVIIAAPSTICLVILYPIGVILLLATERIYSALFTRKD